MDARAALRDEGIGDAAWAVVRQVLAYLVNGYVAHDDALLVLYCA
jgi:hypothetical protein